MKKKKFKKLLLVFIIIGIIIFLYFFLIDAVHYIGLDYSKEYLKDGNKNITFKISKLNPFKGYCYINRDNKKEIKNNKCSYSLENGTYDLEVENLLTKKHYKVKVKYEETVKIESKLKEYYLALGETFDISKYITTSRKVNLSYRSLDDKIASVDDKGVITGVGVGTTNIEVYYKKNKTTIKINTTDLINKPTLNMNKPKLTCRVYSVEDANTLDKILENRINAKGYKTRGGVVEAARFLALVFKYKVPYFFENGRLNNYGTQHHVDGEGRYYHKGLYLSSDKYKSIEASFVGPAMWGCPLTNYDTSYGWTFGGKYPNGLDCSGFVTWVMKQGGFDPGDIGSGITQDIDDLSDIGEMHELTYEYANSLKYKVGDIIARDGHTAMIAGIDDENIYVAESLLKGAVIETFSYKDKNSKLYKLYGYIETLDDYYKEDGNYSNMW